MFSFLAASRLPEVQDLKKNAFGVIIAYHRLDFFDINCVSLIGKGSNSKIVRRVADSQGISLNFRELFSISASQNDINRIINRLLRLGVFDLPSVIEGEPTLGGESLFAMIKCNDGKVKEITINDSEDNRRCRRLLNRLRLLAMSPIMRFRVGLIASKIGLGSLIS